MKIQNQISDEEKRRYVELYLSSDLSMREVAQSGGFAHSALYRWVNEFIPKSPTPRYINVSKKSNPQPPDPRDAEIARLKAALEKAELRAHALDTMIDIAETNFKIKIRKKAGAKQ